MEPISTKSPPPARRGWEKSRNHLDADLTPHHETFQTWETIIGIRKHRSFGYQVKNNKKIPQMANYAELLLL